MINFFKKDKIEACRLVSPVNGKCIQLEEVADTVFASGMMGQGIALLLEEDTIYAPCDAKVTVIPPTKHAIGLTSANGTEILIHVGLDTVNLNGEGFTMLVQAGEDVKAKTALIKVDRKTLKSKGYDLTTPMIITNSNDFNITIKDSYGIVKIDDELIVCEKK